MSTTDHLQYDMPWHVYVGWKNPSNFHSGHSTEAEARRAADEANKRAFDLGVGAVYQVWAIAPKEV